MDRRRKKAPKRHQVCLRLNDSQHELLSRYLIAKDFTTPGAALRYLIDGMKPWLDKQDSAAALAAASSETGYSGLPAGPPPAVVPPPTTDVEDEVDEDSDERPSLGRIGGMLNVGLPGIPLE
jgi:hypothetical protein